MRFFRFKKVSEPVACSGCAEKDQQLVAATTRYFEWEFEKTAELERKASALRAHEKELLDHVEKTNAKLSALLTKHIACQTKLIELQEQKVGVQS